jgi:hypothetical protein
MRSHVAITHSDVHMIACRWRFPGVGIGHTQNFYQINLLSIFNKGISSPTLHHEFQCTMVACPQQCYMVASILHTPSSPATSICYHFFCQNPWFTALIQAKTLLRNASPLYHPPSQLHIMMAACPPHCPTPLPTTTLPPIHTYPTFVKEFKGKAPILKWGVEKMGGCAACR